MNTRRAANRARSAKKARDNTQMDSETSKAGWHSEMRGRMPKGRDENQVERGGNHTHEPHFSHGSPASLGSSKGPGPLPGAGELPAPGVGRAAKSYGGRDISETPVEQPTYKTPKGMSTYNQE